MDSTGRTILIAVLAVIVLPLLWGGMMMGGGMGPWMIGHWYGDNRWEPWRILVGLIPMVIVVGGIVAAVLWGLGRPVAPTSTPGESSARDLLDARYARGEIIREQYQQMRDDLRS